ncbi:MAG TPA: acyl-CoA thioesterase [Kofleriaceae bacterium]|nr:acyl-CoA thioesterase [Kofleriaceae bacterium]
MTAALPFRLLFRVRYHECDAQGIVFNARWAEYADLAAGEFCRAALGSLHPSVTGFDWKLVRQTVEWKRPGRYDDVIEARVRCVQVGTTSFTLATEFVHWPDGAPLVSVESVCVATHPTQGVKQPVSDDHRKKLGAGAPDVVVDHAGAMRA